MVVFLPLFKIIYNINNIYIYNIIYTYIYTYITYIFIYVQYPNLPRNAIVRLSHPWSRDSQRDETFLALSADKETRDFDTEIVCFVSYVFHDLYNVIMYM